MLITREFLKSLNFKPFSKSMWDAFSGCESPVPFYAETDQYLVILDGPVCDVFDEAGDSVACCEDIRELPFITEEESACL